MANNPDADAGRGRPGNADPAKGLSGSSGDLHARLRALYAAERELVAAPDRDAFCRLAVTIGRERLGFDRLSLWFYIAGPGEQVGSYGIDENGQLRDERTSRVRGYPRHFYARLLRMEVPVLVQGDADIYNHVGQPVGRGETAATPIWDGHQVVGVLCFDNLLSHKPIDAEQQQVAALYATIIGGLYARFTATDAILAQERFYSELIDTANAGVWHRDAEGKTVYCNQAIADLLGCTPAELRGRSLSEFVQPESLEDLLQADARRREGNAERYELALRGCEGRTIWCQFAESPIVDQGGTFRGHFALVADVTHRKEHQRAIEDRERFVRSILNSISDRLCILDPECKVVLVNEAWRRAARSALGSLPWPMEGEDYLAALESQAREQPHARAIAGALRSVRHGGDFPLPVDYSWQDGSDRRWFAVEVSRLANWEGETFLVRHTETTDQRREVAATEAVLRGTARTLGRPFFQSLVRELADALDVSHALLAELSRENPEQAVTLAFWADGLLAENFQYDLAGTPSERVLSQGPVHISRDLVRVFPDDPGLQHLGVVSYFGRPVWGANGKAVGLLAVMDRDPMEHSAHAGMLLSVFAARAGAEIERLRAEQALRVSESRYRAAVESLSEGVIIQDRRGRIMACNRSAERILGIPSGEMMGLSSESPIWRTIHEDGTAAPPSSYPASVCLATGQPQVGVVLGVHRQDGKLVWLRVNSQPIFLAGEERPTAAVTSFTDITEERRIQEQLEHARKMESLGQLAGGVAHDFNNLLTAVIGYTEIVARQLPQDAPQQSHLRNVLKAAEQAAALTAQLLAFGRKQVISPRVLDLNAVLEDARPMLERLIHEHVTLHIDLAPMPIAVRSDPVQVQQIVLNLALNARDAMPRGGDLTIECGIVELDSAYCRRNTGVKPGRYALLAVSDTGIGIPPELLHRVFDPFFTTKLPSQGTGLGLATVHGIVTQSGGHIHAYSEPGVGTTFRVYLPLAQEQSEPAPRSEPPVVGGQETILLAEDEQLIRLLAVESLQRLGYTVLAAENGSRALEIATAHEGPIDLLITDVVMPRMGGYELSEKIRLIRPEIRVLFMSGYTDGAVARQGLLQEGSPLLQKPFTASALARSVRDTLDAP